MASFVSTMHDWRRMCSAIQSENQKSSSGSWCRNCPIEQFCVIDTEIKNSTDNVFRIIDEMVQTWADKNKEPVYPTWGEFFVKHGGLAERWENATNPAWEANMAIGMFRAPIPASIAQKLGIEPKGES